MPARSAFDRELTPNAFESGNSSLKSAAPPWITWGFRQYRPKHKIFNISGQHDMEFNVEFRSHSLTDP